MKILATLFFVYIAFAAAVNVLKLAVGCYIGALWGAFHHHGHGKPLLYGAIEGACWLSKEFFDITMAVAKFTFKLVFGAV